MFHEHDAPCSLSAPVLHVYMYMCMYIIYIHVYMCSMEATPFAARFARHSLYNPLTI